MTRSEQSADRLRAAGAEAVVADALDADAVTRAVAQARPDAVIHQLTAIPPRIDPRKIERDFALNDRLRTEGTPILAGGRTAAGATRTGRAERRLRLRAGPARHACTSRTTR